MDTGLRKYLSMQWCMSYKTRDYILRVSFLLSFLPSRCNIVFQLPRLVIVSPQAHKLFLFFASLSCLQTLDNSVQSSTSLIFYLLHHRTSTLCFEHLWFQWIREKTFLVSPHLLLQLAEICSWDSWSDYHSHRQCTSFLTSQHDSSYLP